MCTKTENKATVEDARAVCPYEGDCVHFYFVKMNKLIDKTLGSIMGVILNQAAMLGKGYQEFVSGNCNLLSIRQCASEKNKLF